MKKISLAIIDDEEPIVKVLLNIFKPDKRYRVRGYTSVQTAREEVPQFPPQVLICDYFMPECNGIDMIRELKVQLPKLRSILLTGRGFDQTIVDSLESGLVDFYAAKPWDQKELEEMVKRLAREVAKEMME